MTPLPATLGPSGTAQPGRLLAALREGAVALDGRTLADRLGWAQRYARLLRFRTAEGLDRGDWSAFLAGDPSVLVAAVGQAAFDASAIEAAADAFRAATTVAAQRGAAADLFAAATPLASTLGDWRRRATPGLGLRADLDRLAETSLGQATHDLLALALLADERLRVPVPDALRDAATDLGSVPRGPDPTALPGSLPRPVAAASDRRAFADRVTQAVEALRSGAGYLADRAPALLDETLTRYPGHAPHVGLYLAFLLLFRHAQDALNEVPERHLRWTYQDVLGLAPRGAEAESVRAVFELARAADRHLLPAGTLLRGGKGPDGTERLYATDDDLVVTRARVAEVRALRVEPGGEARLAEDPAALVITADGRRPDVDGVEVIPGVVLTRELKDDAKDTAVFVQTGAVRWPARSGGAEAWAQAYTATRGAPILLATVAETIGETPRGAEAEARAEQAEKEAARGMPREIERSLAETAAAVGPAPGTPAWIARAAPGATAIALGLGAALVWADADASALRDAARGIYGAPAVAIDLGTGAVAWDGVDDRDAVAEMLAPPTVAASPGVFAAPVAASANGLGAEITRDDGSWAPFGDADTPAARLGLALASDVLRLGEGSRRIRVTLTLDRLPTAARGDLDAARAELAANLRLQLTGPKGWLDVPAAAVTIAPSLTDRGKERAQPSRTLALDLALAADAPPVVPYDEAVHALGLDAEAPVLRIECIDGYAARARTASADGLSLPTVPTVDGTAPFVAGTPVVAGDLAAHDGRVWVAQGTAAKTVTPGTGDAWAEATRAHPLRHLGGVEVERVAIAVEVDGVRTLVAQGDGAALDPAKTVAPFGMRARQGARFVVASPELQKPLTSIRLRMAWEGLPDTSFGTHYALYAPTPEGAPRAPDTDDFTADAALLAGDTWAPLATGVGLFDVDSAASQKPQAAWSRTFAIAAPPTGEAAPFTSLGPGVRWGALRLTLDRGFLHDLYPKRTAEVAIAAGGTAVTLPNPPYTPLASDLALDYAAEAVADLADAEPRDAGGLAVRMFHLGPFGAAPVVPARGTEREEAGVLVRRTLLPTFAVHPPGEAPEPLAAAVCLGIEGADPPETLSLLIQNVEGTADPDATPPTVVWEVLEGDTWRGLRPDEVLADTTGGLLRSGIVRLALPRAADATHRLVPTGLRWVRAAVTSPPDALNRWVAVEAQAVRATRVAGPGPGEDALPPETVDKLKTRPPAIKGVRQPFVSVGGRAAEGRDAFVRRVSERTGHRARAITAADYERIALEAFPVLHRVRAVPHCRVGPGGAVETAAPGAVTVVVVPDLLRMAVLDPLRPRVSTGLRAEIEALLTEAAPDAVALAVRNPTYEPVSVSARVRFRLGVDVGYALGAVQAALVDALAPWRDGGGLRLGGRVHRSWAIRFLEARPEVEAVRDVVLRDATGAAVEAAEASSPVAALTSAPSHPLVEWTPLPCATTSS